jgi:hypothetical protein
MLNEELHNLYASPNIVRIVKSRRTKFWSENLKVRDQLRKT